MLGIEEIESGRLIGDCCLNPLFNSFLSRTPDGATIGFQLHCDFWGCGYATETAVALIRFAFEEMAVTSVFGGCHPENNASRRVMEKAGMVYQGTQEDFPGSPDGVESLVFVLDRDQWLAQVGGVATEDSIWQCAHNGSEVLPTDQEG